MGLTDVRAWNEMAEKHGIIPIMLLILLILNGVFAIVVYREVPDHLAAIAAGYEKNAVQLNQAADKYAASSEKAAERFAATAVGLLSEYKRDRISDQHLMVELIRRGNLESQTVADSLEAAAEKSQAELPPRPTVPPQ